MYLTFENPVYLWYLASLPLLVMTHFLSLRSAKRKALRFANFQALKRIAGERFITKNILILVMRVIVLTMLIFAASGLQVWYKVDRAENNFVVALDISSSMTAKDFPPSRLDVAKDLSLRFMNDLDAKTKLGVITFSGVTLVKHVLSDDRIAARTAIEDISITKSGGTDIPGAIITATNLLLAEPEAGKAVILFTDGSNTLGNFIDRSFEEAINYAVDNKVVVHAIGIGSESGPIGYLPEYYNISSTYSEDNLLQLTNSTGGLLYQAKDEFDLEVGFSELIGKSDETFDSIRIDLGLLVIGILLLFIEWGLISSRFRRIT